MQRLIVNLVPKGNGVKCSTTAGKTGCAAAHHQSCGGSLEHYLEQVAQEYIFASVAKPNWTLEWECHHLCTLYFVGIGRAIPFFHPKSLIL